MAKDSSGAGVMRGHVFNCLQYEVNPKTGVSLNFSESNILACVSHKTITRYAYILHDKDTVTEADIETGKGLYTEADLGKTKGRHWHIVLETPKNYYPTSTIAKWLGIPDNMVEVPINFRTKKPGGHGAFIDCVEYLRHSDIHQALLGKYEYDASEVKSNFDWQIEVEAMVLRKTEFERPLNDKEYIKNRVLYKGMPISEVMDKWPTLYQEQMTTIQKLRIEYLNRRAPLPPFRINFYIYGQSGTGKDTMAHALAKALFPNSQYDDDIYFEIGSKKVTFSGYDGQPVIIWSEFRADTFVEALGGYEDVLGTIDIIPKNKREHRKFGDVRLVNSVNIVTSTQDYKDFLRGLIKSGDPDPTQANRRFPIIIPIYQGYFDILLNAGYVDQNDFKEYLAWRHVTGSFSRLAQRLNSRPELYAEMSNRLVSHAVDAHKQISAAITADPYVGMTDEEVLAAMEADGFGEYLNAEQIKEAAKEELVRQAEEEFEKRLDSLLDLGTWFWTDDCQSGLNPYSPHVEMLDQYKYICDFDDLKRRLGAAEDIPTRLACLDEMYCFVSKMSMQELSTYLSRHPDWERIKIFPEAMIRQAIKLAWLDVL